MCGIAGFSLSPASRIDASVLAASLALGIESRGRDATGAAWHDPNSFKVRFSKGPMRASDALDMLLEAVPDNTSSAIVHTRAATQGAPEFNENNHPIVLPGIVGVHNGIICNDREATRRLELARLAEVDSEVIFHIIRDLGVDQVSDHLDGDAAVAWMDVEATNAAPPTVHVAALGGRPVVWSHIQNGAGPNATPFDGIVFASTIAALRLAAGEAGVRLFNTGGLKLNDGEAIDFCDGQVVRRYQVPKITRPSLGHSQAWWDRAEGGSTATQPMFTFDHRRAYTPSQPKELAPLPDDPFDDPFDDLPADPTPDSGWIDEELTRRGLRAIRNHDAFWDTSEDEWRLQDTNEWGDQLWYCPEIFTWAIYNTMTDRAMVATSEHDWNLLYATTNPE